MAGRLLIPSVGIDVALFLWGEGEDEDVMRQNVTDNLDSAMLYSDGVGRDHRRPQQPGLLPPCRWCGVRIRPISSRGFHPDAAL